MHVVQFDGRSLDVPAAGSSLHELGSPDRRQSSAGFRRKESREQVSDRVKAHLRHIQGPAKRSGSAGVQPIGKGPSQRPRPQAAPAAKAASLVAAAAAKSQAHGSTLLWEAGTVEIRGGDGEVYPIRPGSCEDYSAPGGDEPSWLRGAEEEAETSGDPRQLSASCNGLDLGLGDVLVLPPELSGCWDEDDPPEAGVPEVVDEALRASLSATQEELRELCRTLRESELCNGNAAKADCSRQALAHVQVLPSSSTGQVLAERITLLPSDWRTAVVKLLEEAEAEAAAGRCWQGK
ncbi:unnamed protein product [Polarella glacialis]|uniref:Uncharacterized protein n=1 Tax=Polarella glacialis TaxID=89957 RepID=A0A813EKI4_POLGL|nr:unnamed protein product [Polarella glacialis]